jgi:hypothetical protein
MNMDDDKLKFDQMTMTGEDWPKTMKNNNNNNNNECKCFNPSFCDKLCNI